MRCSLTRLIIQKSPDKILTEHLLRIDIIISQIISQLFIPVSKFLEYVVMLIYLPFFLVGQRHQYYLHFQWGPLKKCIII